MVKYIDNTIRKLDYKPQHSHESHKDANFYSSFPMDHPGHNVFDFMFYKLCAENIIDAFRLHQIYVNKYPAGELGQGDWHYDFSRLTALYYPSSWNSDWGGETLFEDRSVEYKRNRFVIFDHDHKHKANKHRNPNDFRYTIAFKIDGKII